VKRTVSPVWPLAPEGQEADSPAGFVFGYGYCLPSYGPSYRSALRTTRTRTSTREEDSPAGDPHSRSDPPGGKSCVSGLRLGFEVWGLGSWVWGLGSGIREGPLCADPKGLGCGAQTESGGPLRESIHLLRVVHLVRVST